MNMNPMQMMSNMNNIMQKIRQIGNPQQFLTQAFLNKAPNPMIGNLIKEANNGNVEQVEQFARNFCKERGVNFDTEFSKFMGRQG